MNEGEYIVFSDDTVEAKHQIQLSKEDEKRLDDIIEEALNSQTKALTEM